MSYAKLSKINVNDRTEKKGKFTYLSWAWAADVLLTNDPEATWTYAEPMKFDDGTLMVFCTVTAFGKAMTCQMPVLDHRNKAIVKPNAFDVNTAMMRALAKCIALHGLGLYIYAGEDLPSGDVEPVEVITPEQAYDLQSKIKDTGTNAKQFCLYFQCSDIHHLPVSKYQKALDMLEAKVKK